MFLPMPMNWESHIVRDPKVCAGEPVFRGTRVTLRTVLASLAEGERVDEILNAFPSLTEDNVRAAIVFAAALACEDLTATGTPMRAEYDFRGGVRGKYAARYAEGTEVVVVGARARPKTKSATKKARRMKS
jgi:uncharacterized protein (DUF433 family)